MTRLKDPDLSHAGNSVASSALDLSLVPLLGAGPNTGDRAAGSGDPASAEQRLRPQREADWVIVRSSGFGSQRPSATAPSSGARPSNRAAAFHVGAGSHLPVSRSAPSGEAKLYASLRPRRPFDHVAAVARRPCVFAKGSDL
jgi:hypothetical protein